MKALGQLAWILKLSFRNLYRQPRRTAAVMLTVGAGSASLFLFQGFNSGIMNQYRDNSIHARYGHGQLHVAGYRETIFEKPWEHWIEDPSSILSRLRKVPHVDQVFPRIEFFALLTNGSMNVSGRGTGIDGAEEARFFQTLNVEEGKMLEGEPDGILLGRGLANALHLKVGDTVTVLTNTVTGSLNGADFAVTGIFHTGSKEFDDVAFRVPLAQAQSLLDTQRVESIALGLDSHESWTEVATWVGRELPGISATEFAVLDRIYYQHSVDWLKSQFGVIRLIILLIVILGIFNIVATAVLERKAEIGNLRANGDSRGGILLLIVSEGLVLGLVGAVAGIFIAWLANSTLMSKGILMPPAPGLTRQFHVRMELDWVTAWMTLALGVICCLLASLLAGWRVVRMPIGEALRAVCLALALLSPALDARATEPPRPEEIIGKVDAIRNPGESYEMRVRIGDSGFLVLISGNSRTLVRTLEPTRDRGRDLLMLGEEMWAYIPNLRRAVRVSLAQKLTGQAANGDISRMRWAGDYSASIESEDAGQWALDLQASKKGLTYERIRVWVDRKDFSPRRAEYMTRAGKILKRARFEDYRQMAGRLRPTRLEIESAVNANEKSTIEVESMAARNFSASEFNPQRLGQ